MFRLFQNLYQRGSKSRTVLVSRPAARLANRPGTRPRRYLPSIEPLEDRRLLSTLTVNTRADENVRDDVLSLREAILVANGDLPVLSLTAAEQAQIRGPINSGGQNTIAFNIFGGLQTIMVGSTGLGALPAVTNPLIIDGYTQPGAAPATASADASLRIELDGSMLQAGSGIHLRAGNSVVRGLAIKQFRFGAGIMVSNQGGNHITGNYLGTDSTGTLALPNLFGMEVLSDNNTIGGDTPTDRNVIATGGTGASAIEVWGSGNFVQGNFIGTDHSGTRALNTGSGADGVRLRSTQAQHNFIGGSYPGQGNVISGNSGRGVSLSLGASNNSVLGNLIGTDATDRFAVGNGEGVFVDGNSNRIGGPYPGEGNVVSGNFTGVFIDGTMSSSGNLVQGNFIGTDRSGTERLPNQLAGVVVGGGGHGDFATNNLIGGLTAAEGNVIAFNTGPGVFVGTNIDGRGHTGNAILSNSIFGNGGLGIDLSNDPNNPGLHGEPPAHNHPGSYPTFGNNLQNYPVLTRAVYANGRLTVQGTLFGTPSRPGSPLFTNTYLIQVFASTAADPSGYGQGQQFLGSTTVQTDTLGNASFNVTLNTSVPVPAFLIATATSMVLDGTSPFNPRLPRDTSEFSAAVRVSQVVAFNLTYFASSGGTLTVNAASGLVGSNQYTNATAHLVHRIAGLTLNADGSFVFHAPRGFRNGHITFQYYLTGPDGTSNTAWVTIYIEGPRF
jgi:hypothetical protein